MWYASADNVYTLKSWVVKKRGVEGREVLTKCTNSLVLQLLTLVLLVCLGVF